MATAVERALAGSTEEEIAELATFMVDGQVFALPLAAIDRVVPMVAVTPLPQAPEIIVGVISVAGRVIPVVNLRRRFKRAERAPALEDRLLLADSDRRVLALWVDEVSGVVRIPSRDIVSAAELVPGIEHVRGVAGLADGLVLIHDLGQCLSLDEEERLRLAMEAARGNGA